MEFGITFKGFIEADRARYLVRAAEFAGFSYCWFYDSHILWRDCYAAIAMCMDVPPPVIRHSLRTFKGVEHRIEKVRELDGVTYINDSKGTNVDSTLKAIATMMKPTVMILGGYDKHVDMTRLCQAIPGSQIKKVVLIGDTAMQIQKGLDEVGFTGYIHAGYDFEKAVCMAREMAEPGWNVVLSPACASFDMFADYEQRGRAFKAIVAGLTSAET